MDIYTYPQFHSASYSKVRSSAFTLVLARGCPRSDTLCMLRHRDGSWDLRLVIHQMWSAAGYVLHIGRSWLGRSWLGRFQVAFLSRICWISLLSLSNPLHPLTLERSVYKTFEGLEFAWNLSCRPMCSTVSMRQPYMPCLVRTVQQGWLGACRESMKDEKILHEGLD